MSLASIYTELHRQAARTRTDRRYELKGGAAIAVRVQTGIVTLTISRRGKRVGDTELITFRRECGVPATAERIPLDEQGTRAGLLCHVRLYRPLCVRGWLRLGEHSEDGMHEMRRKDLPMKGRLAPPKPKISERPADWGPWEWRNYLISPRASIFRDSLADAEYAERMGLKRACLNLVYSVQFFERASEWGVIDHLLLRRHDGGLIFPWADLQRIKDELCGPERVAVEVFPPQSQLVDDANCRHLWVLPQGFALPFGLHLEGWKH